MRKCRVPVGNGFQEATFHLFGTEIVWGDDNMPHDRTVAFVEASNGQMMKLEPEEVRFLDAPPPQA